MNISPVNYTNQKQYKPAFGSFNKSVLEKAIQSVKGTDRAVLVHSANRRPESGVLVDRLFVGVDRNAGELPPSAFKDIPANQTIGIASGTSYDIAQEAKQTGSLKLVLSSFVLGFDENGRCTTHNFKFTDNPLKAFES